MKCEVCQNYFVKQRSFATLWKKHILCPVCEKAYQIEPNIIAIPTSNHPLIVQTMIPTTNIDDQLEQALLLVYPSLFQYPYPLEYEIILFADSWLVATRRAWLPLVSHLGSILVYSLFWFSWEDEIGTTI